jgi:hypothetical protein
MTIVEMVVPGGGMSGLFIGVADGDRLRFARDLSFPARLA